MHSELIAIIKDTIKITEYKKDSCKKIRDVNIWGIMSTSCAIDRTTLSKNTVQFRQF